MKKISTPFLLMITVVALLFQVWVERSRTGVIDRYREPKNAAGKLTEKAFAAIAAAKRQANVPLSLQADPTHSGLIGEILTPVTSNPGALAAKQASINPNFATVFVDLLLQAGVQPGDCVAVSLTGSFPALNIAALSALEVLQLDPIVISSLSASQWGANQPGWLWLDFEKILLTEKILKTRSATVTYGGIEDVGEGLSPEGIAILQATVRRHPDVPLLPVKNFEDSVDQRYDFYRRSGKPIKAFLNIGGATASVGRKIGKGLLHPGLNPFLKPQSPDSVANRFLKQNIPVIHIVEVRELAKRYGLQLHGAEMAPVGEGGTPLHDRDCRWLAGVLLAVLMATLLVYRFI